jgi:hypothetical protein
MSIFGPFDVRPGLLERSVGVIDIITRHRPGTTALRLWNANSIENAYGTLVTSGLAGTGGVLTLTTDVGTIGQSPRIIRRGCGVAECRRGSTSFQYALEDIGMSDDLLTYVRIQEERAGVWAAVPALAPLNANYPIRGPIMVLPQAHFFAASANVLSLQAIAPLNTGCVAGAPPVFDNSVQIPLPLHLMLPRPGATISIRNLSSTGDSMLVSFGLGQPMMEIADGESSVPTGGGYSQPGVRELILAADATAGAVVPFLIEVTIGMEIA